MARLVNKSFYLFPLYVVITQFTSELAAILILIVIEIYFVALTAIVVYKMMGDNDG